MLCEFEKKIFLGNRGNSESKSPVNFYIKAITFIECTLKELLKTPGKFGLFK